MVQPLANPAPAHHGGAAVKAAATGNGGGFVEFADVEKSYDGRSLAVERLNLSVARGEFLTLLGPSGSGKTTTLNMLAGFERPTSGTITLEGRSVDRLPPYERNIGMVVQNYALFPHMRVEENVAFGLRAKGASEDVIRARVPESLAMVGMAPYTKRYPRELSGGQQQRVAIARALAIRPQVLLLDEPLSALDAQIRRSMLDELAKLHRDLPNLTVLYVTHDQTEALTLANHIGIMRGGKLKAFGSAQSLFRQPPNRFAAEFLGRANLIPVTALESADGIEARVKFGAGALSAQNHHGLAKGSDCLLCVRPHDFKLRKGENDTNSLTGVVQSVQWQGDVHNITFEVAEHVLRMTSSPMSNPPAPGAALTVHFNPADVTLVPEDGVHG